MGLKLFDGGGGSDSDGGAGDLSKIEINEEFAKRYEHNKKREDLQRFEELKKKGVIDSDTDSDEEESSEDEEELLNQRKQDLKFFDALLKVRNKDPSLKNKEAKLFDSDNEDEDDDEDDDEVDDDNTKEKKKKKKPMYLKDVTAKQLIEEGPEFEDEEDEEENNNKKKKKKSYFEEQEVLRKEFLDAVGEEDDEGEFLKVKNDKNGEEGEEDDDEREYENKLNEYFHEDEKLDENEKFLKDYFRKKMWLDKESGSDKGLNADGLVVSEDEGELERQEDYERDFNFRFEENAGDRVMGFSRKVEGSVRKKDNARKLQRKNKEERMAQAEFERKEELKHLKNLKKKEMNEKLRKIRETAGISENEVCLLDEDDLEEEFDPEAYDSKMKKAFDEKFYNAEDVDPEFGSDEEGGEFEKPNFDEEDELLGLPKGWDDEYGSGDGFLATRERTLKSKSENIGDEEQPQDGEEAETVSEEGKKKRKRESSQLEKEVITKELEEYYKLDYEDTIGDLKTRFKYRPVNKNTYGLKAKEILVVDDKELNQLVPLKKLATYREDEFIVPRHKIKEQKQKIKSLLKGETSDAPSNDRKRSKRVVEKSTQADSAENEKPKPKSENNGQKVLSRKQRRKQRLSEFKLTPSRLLAYQKITAKSNKKRKH